MVRRTARSKGNGPQGFLLSVHLTRDALVWRLLRLIPLARLRLDRVTGLHAGSWSDFFPQRPRHWKRFLRSRYWLHFAPGDVQRTAPLYVLETPRRRIFVRLQSGFHYRLRLALGRFAERRAREQLRPAPDIPARMEGPKLRRPAQ